LTRCARLLAAAALVLGLGLSASAQEAEDTRTQYPVLLRNSFITINVGALDQPFTQQQLQPGLRAANVEIPRIAVRAMLLGHEFNRFLSAQASYMRPVNYVVYSGVGADPERHHVRVNFGTVTIKARLPLRRTLSAYAEGGLGITSRTGFSTGDALAVTDAHYASATIGGGLEYHVTPSWDVTGGITYLPGKATVNQPHTLFSSGGFRYTMRALPPDRVEANRGGGFIFPRQILQFEYSSGTGYAVNDFVSRKVPVFWGGHAKVDFGLASHYERNVFHTKKIFGLDVGASAGVYKTRQNDERFYTLSVYPLFRFTFLRTSPADVYFAYSLAGPTYISKTLLDDLNTGRHFTFQDFMGVGIFAGRARNVNIGVKINHYSNGNIFTQNAGVKIPLTFSVGYAF